MTQSLRPVENHALDYETLFRFSPGLLLILDPQLKILDASDTYLRATRTARDAVVGRHLFDVFPDEPGDAKATGERNLGESLARVLRDGVPDAMAVQRYPIPRPPSEGGGFEERWWSPSNYPVFGADGAIRAIIHRVEDVTDFVRLREQRREQQQQDEERFDAVEAEVVARGIELQEANRQLRDMNSELLQLRRALERRAEAGEHALRSSDLALRSNEEMLRSIVDTALDGIIAIDGLGTIYSFNRSAEQIFGYEAAEVIGSNVKMLMPEPYHSEHDGYLGRYLRTGEARIIGIGREVQGRRKDGSVFPLELAVSQFEQDGEPRFTGLVRDISMRRKLETQLQMAEKMDAIGRLAAGVAHDFNNLLTVISGYSDLIFHTLPDGHESRPLASEIRGAAKRASSLTRQLLAASRQQVLEPRVLDLNEIIGDTSRMLQRLIGEDVELETVLAPDLMQVKADPGQVGQVILNLAVNARDAMPNGGKLTIRTMNADVDAAHVAQRPQLSVGHYALIAITDSGAGIPADVLPNIFDPFYTTKKLGEGTGLGLSVVHGIVKQSGGAIDVYSELGIGTVFKIYLPAITERQREPDRPALPGGSRGNETVLLVEDERAVRTLASLCLRQAGYRVLEAESGPQALQMLGAPGAAIELVLSDVVMPTMGGRQLAEQIREHWPQVRIVFMSGYTDDAVVRQGVLQADIDFLQKPFTPSTLTRKIREVLDRS